MTFSLTFSPDLQVRFYTEVSQPARVSARRWVLRRLHAVHASKMPLHARDFVESLIGITSMCGLYESRHCSTDPRGFNHVRSLECCRLNNPVVPLVIGAVILLV